MRKGTVAAWLGLSTAIGTRIGLLPSAQQVIGDRPESAAIIQMERQPSEVAHGIVTGESEQNLEEEWSPTEGDGHILRTTSRSIVSPAMPFPPLPSRFLPGPISSSGGGTPDQTQRNLLPSPPVPSKVLPDSVSYGGQDGPSAFDEAERSALK
jgi:hypothetical protein